MVTTTEMARERRTKRDSARKAQQQQAVEAERAILSALNAATVDAHEVPKQGHNSRHHYDYATAEDMIVEAKRHLSHHGLTVLCGSTQIRPGVGDATAILAQHFAVVHKKHGELSLGEREWPIVPSDGRPFDKATAAAHTALLAYFLRDLLQLARTEAGTSLDGDDRDEADDRVRSSRRSTSSPKFTARATRVRRALDATRASLENARSHDGAAREQHDARSKKNLVAGISEQFERLGVPLERRRAESKRLLGRAPATLADLAELVRKLKGLGGDLSSEQLGGIASEPRRHDDDAHDTHDAHDVHDAHDSIGAALESVLADDRAPANDDDDTVPPGVHDTVDTLDGNVDTLDGSVDGGGGGGGGEGDGGDADGAYGEAAQELASDFAEEISR